jgi:hypothetical protein
MADTIRELGPPTTPEDIAALDPDRVMRDINAQILQEMAQVYDAVREGLKHTIGEQQIVDLNVEMVKVRIIEQCAAHGWPEPTFTVVDGKLFYDLRFPLTQVNLEIAPLEEEPEP